MDNTTMIDPEKLKQFYALNPQLAPNNAVGSPSLDKLDPAFLQSFLQTNNPIPNNMSVGSPASTGPNMSVQPPAQAAPTPDQSTTTSTPAAQTKSDQSSTPAPSSKDLDVSDIEKKVDSDSNEPDLTDLLSGNSAQAMTSAQPKLNSVEALKQAQQDRNDQQRGAQLMEASAMIGDALAGRFAKPNTGLANMAKEQMGLSGQKLQDYLQQVEMQKQDPSSDVSKGYRDMLSKIFGKPVDPNMAATDIDKVAPWFAKAYEAQENRIARSQDIETKAQYNNILKQGLMDRKDQEINNKDAMKLNDFLDKGWAARGGQAGVVQNKINSAEAAEKLIDQGRTQPGGLDSRQMEELAQSTSRLLGGGPQASARIEALVPHTLLGRTQTFAEWLSNKPQGQEMQAFTDRLAETVKREKDLATQQKMQFQVEGLPAHQRIRTQQPDLYNNILQAKGIDPSMIDEKGRYKAPGAGGGAKSGGKIQVSNGTETLSIDPSDLQHATADGYKQVQ